MTDNLAHRLREKVPIKCEKTINGKQKELPQSSICNKHNFWNFTKFWYVECCIVLNTNAHYSTNQFTYHSSALNLYLNANIHICNANNLITNSIPHSKLIKDTM